MDDELTPEAVDSSLRSLRIVIPALCAGSFLFFLMTLLLRYVSLEGPIIPDIEESVIYGVLGFQALGLIGLFAARNYLRRSSQASVRVLLGADGEARVERFFSNQEGAHLPSRLPERYATLLIIQGGLLEGFTFFCLVLFLVLGDPFLLIPAGIAWLTLFSTIPTRATFESWLRASVSTWDQF